ncbi:MAG TPA: hypothetical protein P5081_02260 [Phycisphaerae bacterium]|nr:hypothetical protein [Phycisphaerae bacterium]HRW51680.1 hypothetical protein [Phycisphaerae bacterium]
MQQTMTLMLACVCVMAGVACDPQKEKEILPMPDPVVDPTNPGDPTDAPSDPQNDPAARDIKGVWKRISGRLSIVDPFFGDIEFVSFDETGVMRLSIRDSRTNVLHCQDAVFSRLTEDTIIMDGGADFFFDRAFFGARVALLDMADDDSLNLRDDTSGEAAVFERVAEVPEVSLCSPLTKVAEFKELDEPAGATGLAFDGTSLWYTRRDDSMTIPVNPENGDAGLGHIFSSSFRVAQAIQDGKFWLTCNCGSATVAELKTTANVVEEQITATEVGFDFDTDAIAFDDVLDELWLFGFDDDNDRPVFVRMDATQEPDVVLDVFEFPYFFDSIAHDGEFVYGLDGDLFSIIQIDPQTGKAVATFQIPDERVDWRAMEIVDGDFFLLGEEFDSSDGRLIRLSRN